MVTIAKTDQLTETKKVLHVEVPRDKVEEKVVENFAKVQSETALPGFRKGKAPIELVRLRFDKGVREQSVQDIINDVVRDILKEQNIRIVGIPKIDGIEKEPGENKDQPLKFTAEFEYIPSYTLVTDYSSIVVPEPRHEVTETEVAQALEGIRERHAVHDPVKDAPSEKGDMLYVDMKATLDGEPFAAETKDWVLVVLGEEFPLPGVEEALKGTQVDSVVEIDVVLPDDYHQESVRGKTCHLVMTVRSVRRVILPDLNDELAKNVGPYETLADLKDDVRTRLAAQMKERNREQTKQNLIGKLLELHQFPMPESLVTSRFEYLSSLQESQFKRYGISQDTLGENREKIDKANRERAERQTRLSVILADVVERESLILTDDEFDERLEKVAHESGYEPDGFANYVFRKGLDNYYKDLFIEDKALEFLLDKVTLTSSEATTPDSETPDSQTESTSKEAEA